MKNAEKFNFLKLALPFILILIGLNAVAIFTLRVDKATHGQRKEDLLQLRELTSNIMKIIANFDMQSRSYALVPNERFEMTSSGCLESHRVEFKRLDSLFEKLDYHPEGFLQLQDSVYEYYAFHMPIFDLVKEGKQADVVAILEEDRGIKIWSNVVKFRKPVYAYVDKQVAAIEARQNFLIFINSILQLILVILGVPILTFVIWKLNRDSKKDKNLLAGLQEKNRQLIYSSGSETEENSEKIKIDDVVNDISKNLQRAHYFIEQITNGNYEVEWNEDWEANAAINEHNLSGKLVLMRNQMMKVRRENGSRAWFNQGISQLTEILRGKQSADQLNFDEVMSFLVTTVEASLGFLFLLEDNDDEQELLLSAAYAFDRKKFLEKRISPGEGLVGQVFLEKEPLHLQKVPNGYLSIGSGLGNADPTELLILPLKTYDEVIGVLELASLKPFEENQIAFLQKAAEIIASSLSFQRNNLVTVKLLKESQVLTEKLRTQEEELKQNLEEMQATGEESERRQKALLEENEHLRNELQKAKEASE